MSTQTDVYDDDDAIKTSHFQNYADYSRTLRAWLVAYGVGGPVLFVTNEKVAGKVAASGHAKDIVLLFMFGVGLQVLLAFVNKWAAWNLYRGAGDGEHQKSMAYRFWLGVNNQAWLDLAIDFASLVALGSATWLVLSVFAAA